MLNAPAELVADAYQTFIVSPTTDSQIVSRHVALGDSVQQFQPLLTLFSADVAEGQANYRSAWSEWQRVQSLGQTVVGDQRYVSARSDYERSRARLQAFGLNADDISRLQQSNMPALGQYQLRAQVAGTVLNDNFEQGQHVSAGTQLMRIANEQQLWVEAHLPATEKRLLSNAERLTVEVAGLQLQATPGQDSHTIDARTRTRRVRLRIDNPQHLLHPGMFANVRLEFLSPPVIAVPQQALMPTDDGQWQVFVQSADGTLKPQAVELGPRFGELQQISGVNEGDQVVTQGAFFVASQLAKDGFDPHNH